MTLHDLRSSLSEYAPELYEYGGSVAVRCLKLLSGDVSGHAGDLVLGRAEDFVRFGIPKRIRNIVCVGDAAPILPMLESNGASCLAIASFPDLFALYNLISEQICISSQLRRGTDILFSTVSANRKVDVDKIIDAVGELFGNPVALFSASGSVIAYRDLDVIYPELLNDFQFDRLSEAFLHFLDGADSPDDQPQIRGGFLGQSTRAMVGQVSAPSGTLAYCMIFEGNRFSGAEQQLMLLVCAWLAQEMRLGSIELDPNNTFSHKFLSGLIDGHITSGELVEQSLRTMRLDKHPYYYLITLDIAALDVRHGSPRSIGDMLQHKMRSGITTVYDHYLVIMLNSASSFAKDAVSDFSLDATLRSLNASAGVSFAFRSPKDAPGAYRQALKAIEYGKVFDSMGQLFFYTDCMVYDLISGSGQQETPSLSFCLPQLLELLEYDKSFNTQYVYTLYMLIISGGKQTAASKALGIHRTTMQYRVEKITEKTGLDIYDTYNLVRLYLSYGILIREGQLDPEVYYQL